jgi:hypothetical protein
MGIKKPLRNTDHIYTGEQITIQAGRLKYTCIQDKENKVLQIIKIERS